MGRVVGSDHELESFPAGERLRYTGETAHADGEQTSSGAWKESSMNPTSRSQRWMVGVPQQQDPLVEAEFIALDVLHHEARFVFLVGR